MKLKEDDEVVAVAKCAKEVDDINGNTDNNHTEDNPKEASKFEEENVEVKQDDEVSGIISRIQGGQPPVQKNQFFKKLFGL